MCGIVGFLGKSGYQIEKEELQKMTLTLRHRGPDNWSVWQDSKVSLGHTRLSILDLTETGAQPMELYEGGPLITFNGEVYNFLELRHELENLGCSFKGHSDTEVILNVYNLWGLDGLKRLEGIFALAIWDPNLERMVLMRDRFGVKPLYYRDSSLGLSFASEIKAVLALDKSKPTLEIQSFSEYLWYGNTYEDRTFYSGVYMLKPGHWLIIENNDKRILEPWWQIEEWLNHENVPLNYSLALNAVKNSLDKAVKRQLVADVPVGILLSGGLDSSAIAASASNFQSEPLNSYSAYFDFEEGVNELSKARLVASHLKLKHNELKISGTNLTEVLLTLAKAHDEPFADAANIPLYLIGRELRDKIKVVLQGDGGDEIFGGYRRYAILDNYTWWRMWPTKLSKLIFSRGEHGRRFARMAEAAGNGDAAMRMALLLTLETFFDPPENLFDMDYSKFLKEHTDPFKAYKNAAIRFSSFEPVQQMLLTDLTVQLPSQFLVKVDRSTMAAGIESRVPMLDEQVAKIAIGMPYKWKVNGFEGKRILRESQRDRLPGSILDAPKTGFGVPYSYWLRSGLYEFAKAHLLDIRFLKTFHLNGNSVEKMLDDHVKMKRDRGFMLWKLLQLALWRDSD